MAYPPKGMRTMAKETAQEVAASNGDGIAIRKHDGTLVTVTDLNQFHAIMRERAGIVASDRGEEVMLTQALKILAADSIEDIEKADMGGTIQSKTVDGLEVTINSFEPVISKRTDIESPLGYYVSCDAVPTRWDRDALTRYGLTIGENFVLQSGAILFILKVAALEMAGALPYHGMVRAIPTQNDFHVVKLFPAPEGV